jgi:polysaccharide biosynthesis/export protein
MRLKQLFVCVTLVAATGVPGLAAPQAVSPSVAGATTTVTATSPPPADYVIGPDDVLSIVFWRENDLSAEVVVRPDGKISLPVINDVVAMGLTPEQLRKALTEAAIRYVEDPNVSVVVKEIKSRRVFIMGQVSKAGPYSLMAPTTVMQLIALAGGLSEFAKQDEIVILRQEPDGTQASLQFNYRDVMKRKNLQQNIQLKPGDTVIVP